MCYENKGEGEGEGEAVIGGETGLDIGRLSEKSANACRGDSSAEGVFAASLRDL